MRRNSFHKWRHKKKTPKNNKVLICTPEGEIYGLPCKVLESVLLEEGS